jgi:hypothetical protein
MTFPKNFKYFLILVSIFLVIYWFQKVDDEKRCKKREGIYENIKLPLLVTSIIALILCWNDKHIFSILIANEYSNDNLFLNPNEMFNVVSSSKINEHMSPVLQINQPNFDVYTTMPEW